MKSEDCHSSISKPSQLGASFPCPECGLEQKSVNEFERKHMRKDHPSIKYMCKYDCGKGYYRINDMYNHVKSQHKEYILEYEDWTQTQKEIGIQRGFFPFKDMLSHVDST